MDLEVITRCSPCGPLLQSNHSPTVRKTFEYGMTNEELISFVHSWTSRDIPSPTYHLSPLHPPIDEADNNFL